MRLRTKTLTAVLFALLMMTMPVAAAGNTATTPLALGVDLGAPNPPEDVVRYETSTGNLGPGVMVEVETNQDLDSLKTWANASDDRVFIERFNASNGALIAAAPTEIKPGLFSFGSALGGDSTLTDLAYVTGWSWDRQVSYAEPIRNLASQNQFQKPAGATMAFAATGGKYTKNAMAWSRDAPNANLDDVRKLVGADSVSATGAGVDVAVIDSGVNTGNGSLYGNGTAGSSMRVTDAHDFVDSESVDLTVNRSDLTTELAKVGDPNGHGSWVSSAVLNAESGIAPDANLMAYRALNAEGQGSTSDIRAAIARADRQGADIIVMSLGSPVWSEGMVIELKRALSEDGNVTGAFVAVGNSYMTTRYVSTPADVERAIGVTATNAVNPSEALKAYFANTGPDTGLDGSAGETHGVRPDIAAPGMSIKAPVFTAPIADGGTQGTERLSGTSMAAPIAAGVGALLLDEYPTLEGKTTEFRNQLVNSGSHTPNIGTTESVGGMVNASRAINENWDTPAPERNVTTETAGRNQANQWLAGDVGVRIARISEATNGIL